MSPQTFLNKILKVFCIIGKSISSFFIGQLDWIISSIVRIVTTGLVTAKLHQQLSCPVVLFQKSLPNCYCISQESNTCCFHVFPRSSHHLDQFINILCDLHHPALLVSFHQSLPAYFCYDPNTTTDDCSLGLSSRHSSQT